MDYLSLRRSFNNYSVFSLAEIKMVDGHFHRRRLSEWQERGLIKKVIKGWYAFSDFEVDEETLFEIANRIYKPSYVSLETALAYYHLIPESIYGITSSSTRRTYSFKTSFAGFSYRTLKHGLFFGFNLINHNGRGFKIADPEKAVLDYFYLNPGIKGKSDFDSLRINREAFGEQVDEKKLSAYLKRVSQKSLTRRIRSFLDFIKNA
jgi:predicted transcriptional regulator of viral defense system